MGTRAGAQAGPATGWAGPGGPSGVAASDGTVAAHVRVTWNAVAPGMSYRVYRSTSLAGARSVVGAWRTTTEFKDTAAIPGVIYWYWVTSATSAAGAGESGFGTPDSGYRDLAAPAGVRASDGTTTDNVQVTWDSVSGATHYEVHRASAGAAEAMLSRQTGTTCDDTTATPGVVYSYRVRSVHHPASGEDFLGGFSAADTGWRALAPPVVTAVNGTAGVTLSWAAVEGATHYRLSRATTADAATWTPLGTWLTLRTRLISTSGALYWYTVQAAVNSGGERPSAPSAPVSGYRMPAAPAGVQASDGTYADKVRVTWNAVTGARSYQAYRLEGETPVAVGPWQSGTTCDDAGATPAIIHTYRVRAALDAGGTLPGATSATDTGWRATAAPQVGATDGSYADRVRVVWNRPAGATLFRLWRAPSRTGARIALTDWTATTSYQDTTASPGVTYHYAVQAAGDLRLGGLLGWDTGFRALMAAPEVIYATDGDFADKVLVLWDAVAGATHYLVYRSDMAGARSAVSGWQMDTAFEDTDAVPGDLYFYWVRAAADAQGATAGVWGDWDSGWRSVPAPGSVRASQGDYADKVRVTWDALSWDACYRVWRAAGTGEAAPVSPWQETATFDDTTAVVNVEYRYWVEAALDDAGSGAGGLSDPPAPGWRALPAPTGVTVTRAASSLVVSWGAVTGANQYCVYWATAVDGQRNALSTWQAATQCTHVGPIPGVHYFYWVRARSSAAVTRPGVWSEPASGWIPLGVPTSVAATDGGYVDRVRVTWAAVSRATHYRVERAPAESGPWEDVSDWRTGTSFYDTTAVPGVTYHYRVSAAANSAATLPSDASAPDTGWRKLSAPGDVAATDGTESACVRVSWSAAAGAGAYRVFRGTASSGAGRGALGGWRVGTTFDDTSAAPGSTYYYWVLSGVDEAGARQSSFGTADAGWRSLASPTGLAATDGTEAAHVRVTWSAASGATHYRVSRGTAADGSDRSALSGWQAGTTYDDTTAAPGATYFYWVTAAASSAGMGETAFGTPDSGWRPLAAPAGVSAGDGTRTTGVQVTWAAATGATHYRVYRGTAGDGSDRTPLSDWQTGTSYEDSTATPGVDYTYWVMAAASATGDRPSALSGGDGGWRALAAPTGVTASSDLSMHVEVTWNPVEGATYYKAYRSSDAEGTDRAEVGYGWMPGTFFHDYAAAPGETYYYWVVGAVDDAGGRPGAFGGPDAGSLGGSVTPAPRRTPTPDEDS